MGGCGSGNHQRGEQDQSWHRPSPDGGHYPSHPDPTNEQRRAWTHCFAGTTACHERFVAAHDKEKVMPAKSASQQKAAGAALSAKRGNTPKSKLKGPAKSMEESMSEKELEKMASTERKGKPEHAGK
jgi:hypothetical protein